MLQLATLRSEEGKCLRLFVVLVVMEKMYYASFTSMRATVSKFEEFA